MINIHKLDAMYGSFLAQDTDPILLNLESGLTIVPNSEDAFALNPPGTSIRSPINKNGSENTQAVIRAAIPYSKILKMEQDYFYGIQVLAVYKNELMRVMAENFDLKKSEVCTFKLPGTNNSFFRNLDDFAAVEIRLFANTTLSKPLES